MTVSGSDIAAHYRHQAETLGHLAHSYQQLGAELASKGQVVEEQLKNARRDLAAVYLNELSDRAFARVAQLTGFKGFDRRDPRQARDHERKVLESSITGIEADERFARRDQLVGPVGTLTQELENARTTLDPLEQECLRFENQDGFTDLVNIGYDTPNFSAKWWQASYWKYWSAGDRICKALDMKDFGDDLLPAYRKVSEPRNFMRDEVRRITSQIDAVHDITKQRDQAQARLANLDAIYLAEAQDYLGEHLENADVALLEQWAAAEPDIVRPVQIGLRKVAGLAAKRAFISEIAQQGVMPLSAQLSARRQKAEQKAHKFARPKYTYATFGNDMIAHDFEQKMSGLQVQQEKLRKRVDHLVAADNYAGFDLRNDQALWWLYLTQQPPPRLAPSLFDYYQRRPNAQPLTDPDYVEMNQTTPGEAMATAFAAGDMEQGTYLS